METRTARAGDRFEIVRRIGEGGMGVVYEAIDRERDARVALKSLRGDDASGLLRFKQEFRALAQIAHPNLIALHELVADAGGWFFTMELIEGGTDLLSWVRAGAPARESTRDAPTRAGSGVRARDDFVDVTPPSSASEAAMPIDEARLRRSFAALVDGVCAIHAAGKLHRDLKPANVLVRAGGEVVILDFGLIAELGRRSEPDPDRPSSDVRLAHPTEATVSGTIAYMSPEQAAAEPLGEASDWYAVGVMLFEALTGSLPFEGQAVILRKQVLDAPAPSSIVAGVPHDLDALTLALLAREPSMRPSAAAIRAVLGETSLEGTSLAGATLAGAAHDDALPAPSFVGREAALATLASALAEATQGAGAVVRVHGASGAGKSALVERFLERSRSHALVIEGRCHEQESVPWKTLDGVVDSLTRALLAVPEDERALLEGEHVGALVRMFPVLGRVTSVAPAESLDIRALRADGVAALVRVLVRLASRTTVIVAIDDLQWGDPDGTLMLTETIRGCREAAVLFVLGHRSEYETQSEALVVLARALTAQKSATHEVAVGALDPHDARALARACLSEGTSTEREDRVVREADGLPWLVQELARAANDGVPDEHLRADRALLRRAERLPPGALRVLEIVAVCGRPITLRLVRDALGVETLAPEVVRPLRVAGFIRGTGPRLDDQVEPFHDRVREGIVASLDPATRSRVHRALGLALRGHAEPEAVGAHLESGGEPEAAAAEYARAGDDAVRVLAVERAERLYRRALALASETSARAAIAERLVHHLTDLARFAEAYEIGRVATSELGVELPRELAPPVFALGLARVLFRLRARRIEALAELPLMTNARLETAVRLMAATMKAAYQVRPELCIHLANLTVELCLEHGNTPDCAIGYMVHGAIFQGGIVGRHAIGHQFGLLSRALVERFDNDRQRAEVQFVVGYFATSWMRPPREAEALFAEAFESGIRTRDHFHTGCAAVGTIAGRMIRGAPIADTRAHTDALLARIEPLHVLEPIETLRGARHVLRMLSSEDDAAFDRAGHEARLAAFGSQHFALVWFVVLAHAQLLGGDPAAALETLARGERHRASAKGMLHGAELTFVRAAALGARFDGVNGQPLSGLARVRAMVELAAASRSFARWARDCPESFAAKAELLGAELARARGARARATERYRRAAELAGASEHHALEGLAYARAATLEVAGARERARAAYDRWGARGLADAI